MMNKLVYIYVPDEYAFGQVVFKSFFKRLAVDMVNKTVGVLLSEIHGMSTSPSESPNV
jgi:hypothetical protein